MIDTHTHLDYCRSEAAHLIEEARSAGVSFIIQSGTDLERSRRSVELAETFPEVFATVGFHPHEAGRMNDEGVGWLEKWAAHSRVVGIGETGFDFYHRRWPKEVQEEAFRRQLDLARQFGLPVVIHTREAVEDTLAVLDDYADLTVVLHCFSWPHLVDEVVRRGYYVSFAGNVTYKNAKALAEAAAAIPEAKLMLETDAPWLSPSVVRGKPNSPANVRHIYEWVAALRGVTVQTLADQIRDNVSRAFPRIAVWLTRAT
ncbi:MAG: TatD family hydrolase [Thermoleophilia bacterium]|nr:TatD family hydrolase [Thermoleophilia bacterium]